MILTTNAKDEIMFDSQIFGVMTLAEAARTIRVKAGFVEIGPFERFIGVDHPMWYNLEKGKFKNPRTFLIGALRAGYEITITKGENR